MNSRILSACSALLALSGSAAALAQPDGITVYAPINVQAGAFQARAPGTIVPGAPAQQVFLGRVPFSGPDQGLAAPDPALQKTTTTSTSSTAIAPNGVIPGLGVGFANFTVRYAPADPNADVSATHIVEWVNASYGIYNRSTATWSGPFAGNTPWKGFGGGCETNNDGDPIIKYDRVNDVWVYTQFSVSTKPYLQCVAISAKGDPSTIAMRFAYSFGSTDFPDYPKLGIWPGGYFMSFNIFKNGFSFSGPRACAIDSATALAGGAPTMICYQLSSKYGSLLPSDADGPASVQPPAGSPDYFVAYGNNALLFWKFAPAFAAGTASVTGPTTLRVASFSRACGGGTCIPQPNTTQQLDSLADRLMYRNAYRYHNGIQSMVLNHAVTPGNGAASGIRWYEVQITSSGGFALAQQGTYSPDTTARWMGSAAMNGAGTIAVGYSVSSGSVNPGIRVTGRCAGDPQNTLQPEVSAVVGTGSQLPNLSRWGDYSSMVVDPADDATFWYTTQYLKANGTFNWSTAIVPVSFTCP